MKLSFADVLKGLTTPSPPPALKPGARGEKSCYCQGEVLVMLGHYGWIKTFDDVDHADIELTAGRIYVHKRDVEGDATLKQGDIVSFYLYADQQGLGAECCQVDRRVPQSLCPDADEFVPTAVDQAAEWNTSASEFVPSKPLDWNIPSKGFSAEATEFVPSFLTGMTAQVSEATPKHEFIPLNLAFFSDSESDDESSIDSNDERSGNYGDKESISDDQDSVDGEMLNCALDKSVLKPSSNLPTLVKSAPWRKLAQVSDADDSTSAGTGSDSEQEHSVHCAARAPPGLSLPVGWRPPPGLELPQLA